MDQVRQIEARRLKSAQYRLRMDIRNQRKDRACKSLCWNLSIIASPCALAQNHDTLCPSCASANKGSGRTGETSTNPTILNTPPWDCDAFPLFP